MDQAPQQPIENNQEPEYTLEKDRILRDSLAQIVQKIKARMKDKSDISEVSSYMEEIAERGDYLKKKYPKNTDDNPNVPNGAESYPSFHIFGVP